MTLRQIFTLKVSACRMLIIASGVWILLVIGLFLNWDLESPENLHNERIYVRNSVIKNDVETFNNLSTKFTTKEKVEMSMKDIRRIEKIIKQKEEENALKGIVTPIPQKIIKRLGLINPGENGEPVILEHVDFQIKKLIDKGWHRHEFNEFVSDLVALNRSLPDPREDYCKQDGLYLENLPSTSVIIIFHNEAWSTLLRSVHSVLNRSPEHLIHEIILVDDFSNMRKNEFHFD